MAKKTKTSLPDVADLKALDLAPDLGLPVEKKEARGVKAAAARNYLCRVNYVGRTKGKRIVGLKTDDDFYYVFWPRWAWALAETALVNQRKLSVWASGRPDGPRLSSVFVTYLDA